MSAQLVPCAYQAWFVPVIFMFLTMSIMCHIPAALSHVYCIHTQYNIIHAHSFIHTCSTVVIAMVQFFVADHLLTGMQSASTSTVLQVQP